MGDHRVLINRIDTAWRPNLAYAVGLIASDGYIRPEGSQVQFCSKEVEMVNNFKKALEITKEPVRFARGGESEKKYLRVYFKSRQFYDLLFSIGITTAKSKTIKSVSVPDEYFADFLRGLFDGDGTFWTWWDKRWPNSFGYTLGLCSASPSFIAWLKKIMTKKYGVKGFIHYGAGVYTIRYVKRDTRKIFANMYYAEGLLYLQRKYHKIKNALDFDDQLKQAKTTKQAVVAQW